MRTLKAVLCLSALAAGIATSVAQSNVYSLNIVGYVNVAVPSGYSLLANPLKAGATNGANEIMPIVPDEVFLTWNGAGYNYAQFSSIFNDWVDADLNPSSPPQLPPGKGFFYYNPGSASTVTFVGEVVPAPGTTSSLALASGYSMLGSPLPASATAITAAPVGLPVIPDMLVLKFTGASFTYAQFSSIFNDWVDADLNVIPAPNYAVGQGFFFYNPSTATTWNQSLP